MVKKIIKNGLPITFVDFSKRGNRDKWFKNSVGLYDPNTDQIFVDSKLKNKNFGTRDLCIYHELAHARLKYVDADSFAFAGFEELFVELEAVTRTKAEALTIAERILKAALTENRKLKPSKGRDFIKIVKNICNFIGVRPTKGQIKLLAFGVKNVK